jgi:phage terminase small subunit
MKTDKSAKERKLTPKQSLFIKEYIIDFNAAAAARRAGYSERTSKEIGFEHLTKPHIQAAVQAEKDKRSARTEISQDRVLKEYARLAFLDPREFYDESGNLVPIHKLSDDAAACISGIDTKRIMGEDDQVCELVKIKLTDKRASLSDVSRHLGMFEKDNAQPMQAAIAAILSLLPESTKQKIKDKVMGKING